jgi:hypothetical protein
MTYAEKLRDPRWQKKRLEIFSRDDWKCKSCGEKEKTLHVHHIFYSPNKDPWETDNGFLITFCEDCHLPGPCEGRASCKDCSENIDCDGPGNPSEDLKKSIASLLNHIFAKHKDCDYMDAFCKTVLRV